MVNLLQSTFHTLISTQKMEKLFHFHLFISIFFSILFAVWGNKNYFSPLNSTFIKQAKEIFMSLDPSKLLDPPMPSYAFTIYHRDVFEKSKFKNYDSLLKNRLARCEDRANYIASILDDNNNVEEGANYRIREKVPKSTSIYFAHGEYVASFLLGSNEIKTLLQIDTGSDLVWWQCGPCEANKCYKQVDPLYFPTNSKTYRKIDCKLHSSRCLDNVDKTYKCNSYNNECNYNIRFISGQRSKGFMSDDVITFALDHLPIRVTFGCGKDQMGRANFSGYYSGIVGLGRRVNVGSYSLPSQFQSDLMSICLPGFYSGKSSTLSFHTATWPRTTSAELLQNKKFPLFYYVNLYKVFINDKEIPVHPSWWTFTKGGGGGVLVDTGTTITRFPKDLYTVFRYTFLSEIKDIPLVKGPSKILDTCFKEDPSGRELYFPVVKLYFGGVNPNNMLLLAKDRVMVHLQGHYCLGFMGWNRSHSIIGSNQLQGIGLTFDTSENTLSFDLDACS